ncbi:unnamed protein product, partial [Didymodactylos carnosus]
KLTKSYQPKRKEDEEFYSKYSFTIAYTNTLKELQDLASQHELISENLKERVIKQIQTTVKECREQRKKCLDEYTKIKRQLDKQHELMTKYDEAYESARRAKDGYEKAHEDLDLSRAQLEKARDTMTTKSKLCDESKTNYSLNVKSFNDVQRIFYERQLPSVLNELQEIDCKRSNELKDCYFKFIQSNMEVLPRIEKCLEEMHKQTQLINSIQDCNLVIDDYKSGYLIPDDQKEIDLNDVESTFSTLLNNSNQNHNNNNITEQQLYNINLNNSTSLDSGNILGRSNTLRSTDSDHSQNGHTLYVGSAGGQVNGILNNNNTQILVQSTKGTGRKGKANTIRKIFGGGSHGTQRKPNGSNYGQIPATTPYGTLPPAQRLKKFQEHINSCKVDLDKKQKAKEGLLKMKAVFMENPKFGPEQEVNGQLVAIDEQIEKLIAEIKRFESYTQELERSRLSDVDSRLRANYGSDLSIGQTSINSNPGTPAQNRSIPDYDIRYALEPVYHIYQPLSPPDTSDHGTPNQQQLQQPYNNSSNTNHYNHSSTYQRLPSVNSTTIEHTSINLSSRPTNDHHSPSYDRSLNASFDEEEHSISEDSSLPPPIPLNVHNHSNIPVEHTMQSKAHVLYEFNGETVYILEYDQGDGWTRIQKVDGSSGFVPSSYIKQIRQDDEPTTTSFETGRF